MWSTKQFSRKMANENRSGVRAVIQSDRRRRLHNVWKLTCQGSSSCLALFSALPSRLDWKLRLVEWCFNWTYDIFPCWGWGLESCDRILRSSADFRNRGEREDTRYTACNRWRVKLGVGFVLTLINERGRLSSSCITIMTNKVPALLWNWIPCVLDKPTKTQPSSEPAYIQTRCVCVCVCS